MEHVEAILAAGASDPGPLRVQLEIMQHETTESSRIGVVMVRYQFVGGCAQLRDLPSPVPPCSC